MKFLTEITSELAAQLPKSYWLTRVGNFTQDKILNSFVSDYDIQSCVAVNSSRWNTVFPNDSLQNIVDLPELLIYTVDTRIEINELINQVNHLKKHTRKFLYTPINKFKVYSDTEGTPTSDYDNNLVSAYLKGLSHTFSPIAVYITPMDHGTIGNFVHPATQIFLEKC
jgi:hypothetical protein